MRELDPFSGSRALRCPAALEPFSGALLLAAADVHVAATLARLAGGVEDDVLLAAALAVRAPRLGHVHVDLATIAAQAAVDVDPEVGVDPATLPWPMPGAWVARVADSPLVGRGRPLRLEGSRLYLARYLAEEEQVAADLLALAGASAPAVDEALLQDGLRRLFGPDVHRQRDAAVAAVTHHLAVVAGGPGTGKTTTVARIVALVLEQALRAGGRPPLVALAAPTGKAAARLTEAVLGEAQDLDVPADVRAAVAASQASTLHRLLGWRPDSAGRFRHDRANRLPHDLVVVDETSMVSLTLMARLLEALRPDARLVLVGDPAQLASVEAGTVLGDVVAAGAAGPAGAIGSATVVLDRPFRYREQIATVARAIEAGDAGAVVEALRGAGSDVVWIEADAAEAGATLEAVRAGVAGTAEAVRTAAADGDAAGALTALGGFRLLCAHRRGPYGVTHWTRQVERWSPTTYVDDTDPWYVGRPVLVTGNDASLGLFNGDVGVAVADGDRLAVAFERRGEPLRVPPSRLEHVETVHAMTIHKSQGSQFGTVAVVLPGPDSRILTRELLYTGITRAQDRLLVVGTEEVVRAAVQRPVARASGLRERLVAG